MPILINRPLKPTLYTLKVISWGANTFGQLGIGLVGSEGNCDSKGGGGSWYEPSFVDIDVWRQPLDEVCVKCVGCVCMKDDVYIASSYI